MWESETDEDDHYMEMVRMYHQLWNANRELVEQLHRRLSWTALAWLAGGLWFGVLIGIVIGRCL